MAYEYNYLDDQDKIVKQLLSVSNIRELNNLGKYLLLTEKIRNA
jgi:hypothetical protein